MYVWHVCRVELWVCVCVWGVMGCACWCDVYALVHFFCVGVSLWGGEACVCKARSVFGRSYHVEIIYIN